MSRSADEIFNLEDQYHAVVPAKTGYVAINKQGKDYYFQESQAFVRPRHPKRIEFGPQTVSTVVFGSGDVVTEFKITEQTDFEQIEHLSIRGLLTKTNVTTDTGSTVLAVPTPLWIRKLEIFTGGTTKAIQTLYGDQLWTAFQCFAKEQLEAMCGGNLLYMSPDFKANNATPFLVNASGDTWQASSVSGTSHSRAFVIPLLGLVTEKFRLRALSGDTIIRITWAGNEIARPIASDNADSVSSARFRIEQFSLLLESEEVMKQDKDAYSALLKSNELYVKYLEPIEQRFTLNMQAGTTTPLQLTSVEGEIALMQIFIRSPGRKLTDLVTLSPSTSSATHLYNGPDTSLNGTIQLEQSNGQVIISQSAMKAFEMRYMHTAKHFMNTFTNDIALYQISFSETPAVGIIKGNIDGYVNFNGNEYIKLTPSGQFNSPSLAALSVEVKVVAWRVQHLCLKDRKADVIR